MSAKITVVGLGSGDESQLTLGVWQKLQSHRVYLRTAEHPVVNWLREQGIAFQSFDDLYEAHTSFPQVYEAIADALMNAAEQVDHEIVYAVPGHPKVAEYTVQLLAERCLSTGTVLAIQGGESFIDQAFLRFGFDPIEGFQLLDAARLTAGDLNPSLHTIIAQVYDSLIASDVKLHLMEIYPDEYEIIVGHSLGVAGVEQITAMPLWELDRLSSYGNLTLVWIPRDKSGELRDRSFTRLHEIVQILRSPEGCPWDREQTHSSIRKNLIEETYEVLETIDDDDPQAMCEELGDVLLQVMLHAQMEEETGMFTIRDIVEGLNQKLIRRHPHVFGSHTAENAGEALRNWQEIKAEEKRVKGVAPSSSVLDGVPRELPGLLKAWKLQKKAAHVGFDWKAAVEVMDKVGEELDELREAIKTEDTARYKDELGDVLFSVVNLARFLRVDPEEAIAAANRKFISRFRYIESKLSLMNRSFDQTSLEEMNSWWNQAKDLESSRSQ